MHSPLSRLGVLTTALACLTGGLVLGSPTTASAATADIAINEIETTDDWVELINTGTAEQDVSGLVVKDNDGSRTLAIPGGTVLAAGERIVIDVNASESDGFGLGRADSVRLYDTDGTTLLDSYSWTQFPTTSYGRCPRAPARS